MLRHGDLALATMSVLFIGMLASAAILPATRLIGAQVASPTARAVASPSPVALDDAVSGSVDNEQEGNWVRGLRGNELAIFAVVYVVAILCNGLLNHIKPLETLSNPRRILSSPLGILSYLLFIGTLYLGWQLAGVAGAIGSFFALIVGMGVVSRLLKGRVAAM